MNAPGGLVPVQGNALLVVDVQNDFLPGGALAVEEGEAAIPVPNDAIRAFEMRGGQRLLTTPTLARIRAHAAAYEPEVSAGLRKFVSRFDAAPGRDGGRH